MEPPPRPRLQRSASARPAPLRRSGSLFQLFQRVPSFRNGGWGSNDDDYSSSGDEELHPLAPPSPAISAEKAKRARKQKLQRLFKQGVSKVMKERAEEMDEAARMGSLYAMDAFAGRLQHGMAVMSTKSRFIFAAFRLQISAAWMWTIIACSVAHCLLVFLEPRPGMGHDDDWLNAGVLRAVEVTFITVYALDVSLKVAYMGLKNYLKKPWQKLMIAIVLILAVDACGVVGVRFARALRPAILSLRTRSIRRFYTVVSNMLPGFLRVCLPVLFFLLLSASYAALSFGRAKSDFEDPTAAGYAIWILMVCADNYESLVNEPSQHPAYIPFVVMIIIVGSMFLLSLLLGVTYDVFIEHTTEQVKSERLKELKGLNMAFATMDPTGTGKLSMVVWQRFLLHLMPRTTQQERALYFEIASGFGDELDVLGFMDLRQVLSYSFVNAIERVGQRQKCEKMPTWLVWLLEHMEAMLQLRFWRHTVGTVVLLDCLLLPHDIPHQGPALWVTRLTAMCGAVLLLDQALQVAEFMRKGSGPGPLRLSGKSLHAKVAGVAVVLHILVVALLHCPPLLSLGCSLVSVGGGIFSSPRDVGSGGDETGVCPLEEDFDGVGSNGRRREQGMCIEVDWCMDWFLMLAYTLRLVRCWRLVTLNDALHDHVDTFFSVIPVFAQTLSFALIVAYAFAMVAMQLFADKAEAFSDAGMSLRTTLQLFVGVDFSSVVENTVAEVGPVALLFFIAYHVVGVLIVFNLLTAIMIQLYGEALNEKSRHGMEEQRKAVQELQDSLYEHNHKQRVLRMWGRRVTQGAASLNIRRGTQDMSGKDARRVLGSVTKSQVPTAEELKQCQQHAKVDLLRALRDKTQGDTSLRTFERSFYHKLKSTAGGDALKQQTFRDGEIIYMRGDQNHTCFFVHKGVVRLESADGTIETKEKGEMFGEEALVASLTAGATAIAEGAVECVGLDRTTFTETHGTLENLGLIFLRLQRSGSLSVMEPPPSDGSRRSGFSAASGNRSTRMGLGSLGTSSQFELTVSDLQLERWHSRRNIASSGVCYNGRSSRSNMLDEGVGGSGSGGGDRGGGGGGIERRRGGSTSSEPSQRPEARASMSGASALDVVASSGKGSGNGGSGTWKEDRGPGARLNLGRRASEIPRRLTDSPSLVVKKPQTERALSGDSAMAAPRQGMDTAGRQERVQDGDDGWGVERALLSRDPGRRVRLERDRCRVGDLESAETEGVGERGSGSVGDGDSCGSGELVAASRGDGGGDVGRPPPRMRTIVSGEHECTAPGRGVALSGTRLVGACNPGVSGVRACGDGTRGGSTAGAESTHKLREAPKPERWSFRTVITEGGRERDTRRDVGGGVDRAVVDIVPQRSPELAQLTIQTSPELSPSAAPSSRQQQMFKGFGSSLSRRESSDKNNGSGMSTWSTNSPSPVLGNERDVGVADEE